LSSAAIAKAQDADADAAEALHQWIAQALDQFKNCA